MISGGAPAVQRRRRRFEDAGGGEEEEETGCSSSSACAAAVVADCVALGCCPCAVVASLLRLALVRAPLAVGRRCARGRRVVRDVSTAAATSDGGGDVREERDAKAECPRGGGGSDEEELERLEEMYRTARWGFGRVSFSSATTA